MAFLRHGTAIFFKINYGRNYYFSLDCKVKRSEIVSLFKRELHFFEFRQARSRFGISSGTVPVMY